MLRRNGANIAFAIFLVLTILLTGCGLLGEPPQPVIPTPVPTAPALPYTVGEQVVDPVSDVVPGVDPQIADMLNLVSQQQLSVYVQTLEGFGTRNAFSDVESETFGVGATRRWIFSEFERVGNGRLEVNYQDFTLSYNGLTSEQRNIVARLPGTGGGDGVIIVMAHYDNRPPDVTDGFTRASGANDNASGVALLLETARVLSSRQWKQNIIFLALAAEEQGTFGSRHFAQNAFLDGMNVLAAINYDSVGGRIGIPQSVRVFADQLRQSPAGALGRYYNYIGGLYLPTFPVVVYDALDREGRWGDQREFVKVGMPSVRVIESQEDPDLINSMLDTWTYVDYDYLQKVTQLNVAVVANAVGAPHPPAQPQITPMADPGAYLLTWPVEPDVAGYAIAFRPLDAPEYPAFRFVKGSHAGNVVLTGYDPSQTYAVSLAALDENGRLGYFTPEQIVGPPPGSQDLTAATE